MLKTLVNFLFMYAIIWPIIIFMVLPFGIQRDANPEAGNDHGAPTNPNIKKKFIITTILALMITIGYMLAVRYNIIDWQKLAQE